MSKEYVKNDELNIKGIGQNGSVGQIVILTPAYGPKDKGPQYAIYKHLYAVCKIQCVSEYEYILQTQDGTWIVIPRTEERHAELYEIEKYGYNEFIDRPFEIEWIYDITEYLEYTRRCNTEIIRSKNAKIKSLSADREMLIGILSNQGVRVVTEEQANILGLK